MTGLAGPDRCPRPPATVFRKPQVNERQKIEPDQRAIHPHIRLVDHRGNRNEAKETGCAVSAGEHFGTNYQEPTSRAAGSRQAPRLGGCSSVRAQAALVAGHIKFRTAISALALLRRRMRALMDGWLANNHPSGSWGARSPLRGRREFPERANQRPATRASLG